MAMRSNSCEAMAHRLPDASARSQQLAGHNVSPSLQALPRKRLRACQYGSYGALLLDPWVVVVLVRERTPPSS